MLRGSETLPERVMVAAVLLAVAVGFLAHSCFR